MKSFDRLEGILDKARLWSDANERQLTYSRLFYCEPHRRCALSLEFLVSTSGTIDYLAISDVYHAEFAPTIEDQELVHSLISAVIRVGARHVRRARREYLVFGDGGFLTASATTKAEWCPWVVGVPPRSEQQILQRIK